VLVPEPPSPGKLTRYFTLRRHGVDPGDRSAWPDQHRWFQENLEALHRVFAPRIKALKGEEVPVE
jgi:hypothetical protein